MTTGFQQQSFNLAPMPRAAKRPQHIGQLAIRPRPEEPRTFLDQPADTAEKRAPVTP